MAKRTVRKPKSKPAAEKLVKLVRQVNTEHPPKREVALLDQQRQNPEVWRAVSDLRELAHTAILKPFAPAARTAIRQRLEALQETLGYAESPAIERLLIEQISTSWLHLQLVQVVYANGDARWEKRLTVAQGRYLKAIEKLAQVRRRLRPDTVQVNIGAPQMNVAGMLNAPRKTRNQKKSK